MDNKELLVLEELLQNSQIKIDEIISGLNAASVMDEELKDALMRQLGGDGDLDYVSKRVLVVFEEIISQQRNYFGALVLYSFRVRDVLSLIKDRMNG